MGMKALELGEILETLGVPVLGYREDDGKLGASVRITDTVHVEIETAGDGATVVVFEGDRFVFFDTRTEMGELVGDLVKAGAVSLH
jgi:hypothetical protein